MASYNLQALKYTNITHYIVKIDKFSCFVRNEKLILTALSGLGHLFKIIRVPVGQADVRVGPVAPFPKPGTADEADAATHHGVVLPGVPA